MITNSQLIQAQMKGSYAAAKELSRLKVDRNRPLDIFQVIHDQRLWLMFKPLDDLLGAYLNSGILINSRRPRSMQRFTAAHEYGHHVLNHLSSFDRIGSLDNVISVDFKNQKVKTSDALPSQSRTEREALLQEAEAQAFASDFLMHPQLVNSLWSELNLPHPTEDVTPKQVYVLSLFLGTSFTATVTQLIALDKVSRFRGKELYKCKPKEIKKEIAGHRVPNSRVDIWPLDKSIAGRTLDVRILDEIQVSLPEAPSTGFIWEVSTSSEDEKGSKSPLDIIADCFEPSPLFESRRCIGGEGTRLLTFQVVSPGYHHLVLCERRPWDISAIVDSFEIAIQANDQMPDAGGLSPPLWEPLIDLAKTEQHLAA